MAFTPFTESDLPTMSNFNSKFGQLNDLIATAQSTADGKGNCSVEIGQYSGTGSKTSKTFSFGKEIALFVVADTNLYSYVMYIPRGATRSSISGNAYSEVTWTDERKGLYWSTPNTDNYMNMSKGIYLYAAFLIE